MSSAPSSPDDHIARALAIIALASVTVLLSVGASNAGMWSFSPYLLTPSVVAFLLGATAVVLARRRGHVEAGTVAGVVVVFVAVAGGRLLLPLGGWGILVLLPAGLFAYWLARRLSEGFGLRWVTWWMAAAFVLTNAVFLVQIAAGELGPGTEAAQADSATRTATATGPDVVVLILDEFASPVITPLQSAHRDELASLRSAGYEVEEAMLSAYTISAVSIPAILDGSYPLFGDEVLDDDAEARLGAMSRGQNRLVRTLKAGGYRYTHVESGIWMSACGPHVDTCVGRHPLDEPLGLLLKRSAFRWWYERLWGSAFIVSGRHTMEVTRDVLLELARNEEPDLIVSHIMLPHFPYLLGEDCERHPRGRHRYRTRDAALSGYQRQAGCVVGWLTDTLARLEGASSVPPAVLVAGDHGTNLGRQLERPVEAWSPEDMVERLSTFVAYRLPEGCPKAPANSTPQVTDALLACVDDSSPSLPRQHFLISNAAKPAEVTEYSSTDLDQHLSAISGGTSQHVR